MRRPVVKVRELPHRGWHIAWCYEDGCEWLYANVVKTDVREQATHHRGEHRQEARRG